MEGAGNTGSPSSSPSRAEDNGNLTVMGRVEGLSLLPWHCGIHGRSATALSLGAVGLGGTGSLRDPAFSDQFSRLSTDKLSYALVLSQNPTVKLYRNS